MKELNFNDYTSYMTWRKEWFAAYKAAIAAVRAGKVAFKDEQRKVTVKYVDKYGGYYVPMVGDKELSWVTAPKLFNWYGDRVKLVKEIDDLVALRSLSRVKSGIQREEMLKARELA